jgi:predicted nucleotidyltransferase
MIEINALKEKLLPICQKYKVEKAVLFGSLARNEASRHSDIDIIIVQNTTLRFLDRYDGILAAFCRALPEWDVDLLIYTPEELAKISARPFIMQAMKEGKVLYESI